MECIDYLAIGHVCRDLTADGSRPGGTATYAALTARAFGLSVAIVTSAPPDHAVLAALRPVPIAVEPSAAITTFENYYLAEGRRQILTACAAPLGLSSVPPEWRQPRIVHLGPVAGEVDLEMVAGFPRSFIAVTPQGWMRRWDADGRVFSRPWETAEAVLEKADAVVMSLEDLDNDERLAEAYAHRARTLVLTRGAQGCTLFTNGRAHEFATDPIHDGDPTGAGDIFAAVFFILLHHTGDPYRAAGAATRLASASVRRVGLASVPTPEEAAQTLPVN